MQTAQNLCHRCSSHLPEQALFCNECGSPQLVLTETDAQRIVDERAASTGVNAPPPRATADGRIRWRPVLRIVAAIVTAAAVADILGNMLPFFGIVRTCLIFLGPMFAINLYRRRMPGAQMSAGIGARIGTTFGVMIAFVVTATNAAFVLIYRYSMHNGAQMDRNINTMMQQSLTLAMTTYPSLYPNPGQTMQVLQYFQSPDGHVAYALIAAAGIAVVTLAYSAFSGAMWGWWAVIRFRAKP